MEDKINTQLNEQIHPDGWFRAYHDNGTVRFEAHCNDDGQFDGQAFEWMPNGEIAGVQHYKNGKLNGPATLYASSFSPYLQHDDIPPYKEEDRFYKDGKLDGLLKAYHRNGKVKSIAHYKDGKLDGEYKSFYDNGALCVLETYKDGKLDGPQQFYYKNGQLREKYSYKSHSNSDGKLNIWDEEGHLIFESHFKNNLLDGPYKKYDTNGKVVYEVEYKENRIVHIVIPQAEEISDDQDDYFSQTFKSSPASNKRKYVTTK